MKYILLAILCLPASAYAAEAYKWTDSEGEVHYSDIPPGDSAQPPELIILPTPSAPSASSRPAPRPAGSARSREIERARQQAQQQQQRQQRQAQQREQEERDRANCQKYTELMKDTRSLYGARHLARQAWANGNYWQYRKLKNNLGRRQLRQEYAEKVRQYCK